MNTAVWPAVAVLAFGVTVLVLTRLPPRRAAAALLLAGAAGLALLRQFPLAVALAAFGIGLWRSVAASAAPSSGRSSEVRSDGLAMWLDHDSGEMDGEVLAGPFEGSRLSDLPAETLQRLVEQFEANGDEDSLSLLLAWLERRGPARATPPPAQEAMSEAEAYRVLGLAPGASIEEVRGAYRRLMRRVHPDLGGSSALAAMINAAKEVLDPG
jgi:hypothetical protein